MAALSHETQSAGPQRLTVGWREEPALAGVPNAVDVAVVSSTGAPVADAGGSLRVEVSFGDQVVVLALVPGGSPGLFSAPLVPTRAGTYTFHVTGSVGGHALDITSTCSDRTFDCVGDPAEAQFPAKDPSTGQVAARAEQADRRAARAEAAADDARTAAAAALGVGAVALVVAGASLVRGRRRPLS